MKSNKIRIAVFASGGGSNAERFFEHFKHSPLAKIALVCSNRADAFVLERAQNHQLPTFIFTNRQFAAGEGILEKLQQEGIDFIVLAGFLRLVPEYLIRAYPQRIVNIHPALLPKWGGRGMWGHHVHEAVVAAKELESGISIHYVDERYDEGDIIFQTSCPLTADDTPEQVAAKVLRLEHEHYPRVVEDLLKEKFKNT